MNRYKLEQIAAAKLCFEQSLDLLMSMEDENDKNLVFLDMLISIQGDPGLAYYEEVLHSIGNKLEFLSLDQIGFDFRTDTEITEGLGETVDDTLAQAIITGFSFKKIPLCQTLVQQFLSLYPLERVLDPEYAQFDDETGASFESVADDFIGGIFDAVAPGPARVAR